MFPWGSSINTPKPAARLKYHQQKANFLFSLMFLQITQIMRFYQLVELLPSSNAPEQRSKQQKVYNSVIISI